MPFKNEYISAADQVKYDIARINALDAKSNYQPIWTVDRDKDVYLRLMRRNRDFDKKDFTFYWKGTLTWIALSDEGILKDGRQIGTRWAQWPSTWNVNRLPEALQPHYSAYIADLKAALTAHKVFGIEPDNVDHVAYFDF